MGDQGVMSHVSKYRRVGKSRRGFPTVQNSPSCYMSGTRVQCVRGALYSDSKNPFNVCPNFSVQYVAKQDVGISLSFG